MMDFLTIADDNGFIANPYAAKQGSTWLKGQISAEFLNTHFGSFVTAAEMKDATNSEGLRLFFDF
jgi:hypothetical protein